MDILVLINKIGVLVHGATVRTSGFPNRNVGDAFVLVWKLPPVPKVPKSRDLFTRGSRKAREVTASLANRPQRTATRKGSWLHNASSAAMVPLPAGGGMGDGEGASGAGHSRKRSSLLTFKSFMTLTRRPTGVSGGSGASTAAPATPVVGSARGEIVAARADPVPPHPFLVEEATATDALPAPLSVGGDRLPSSRYAAGDSAAAPQVPGEGESTTLAGSAIAQSLVRPPPRVGSFAGMWSALPRSLSSRRGKAPDAFSGLPRHGSPLVPDGARGRSGVPRIAGHHRTASAGPVLAALPADAFTEGEHGPDRRPTVLAPVSSGSTGGSSSGRADGPGSANVAEASEAGRRASAEAMLQSSPSVPVCPPPSAAEGASSAVPGRGHRTRWSSLPSLTSLAEGFGSVRSEAPSARPPSGLDPQHPTFAAAAHHASRTMDTPAEDAALPSGLIGSKTLSFTLSASEGGVHGAVPPAALARVADPGSGRGSDAHAATERQAAPGAANSERSGGDAADWQRVASPTASMTGWTAGENTTARLPALLTSAPEGHASVPMLPPLPAVLEAAVGLARGNSSASSTRSESEPPDASLVSAGSCEGGTSRGLSSVRLPGPDAPTTARKYQLAAVKLPRLKVASSADSTAPSTAVPAALACPPPTVGAAGAAHPLLSALSPMGASGPSVADGFAHPAGRARAPSPSSALHPADHRRSVSMPHYGAGGPSGAWGHAPAMGGRAPSLAGFEADGAARVAAAGAAPAAGPGVAGLLSPLGQRRGSGGEGTAAAAGADGMVYGRRKEDVTRKAEDALVGFLKILVDLEVANTAPRSEATDLAVYSRHRGIAARWEARGELFKVQLGCGLHMGTAIEGAIGSKWKIDASYLSPAVNLSARLEAATKQYGVPLLISHDFALQLSEPAQGMLRLLDCVAVKGSLEPMRIYTFDLFSYPRDFGEDVVLHWDRAADGFEPLPQQYLAAVARNVLLTRLGPRAVLPSGPSAQSQVALLSPLGARDSGRQLPWDLGPLPGVPLVRRESGASASSVGLADGWVVGAPATPIPAGARVGSVAANDHTEWPAHATAEQVAQAAHLQHPAVALPGTPVGSAPTHVPRLSHSALRSPAAHAPSLSGVLTAGETPLAVPADPSVSRLLAQQAVPDFRIRIDFASDPYLREMQSISRDKAAGFDFPSETETVAWYRARFGLPALANPARSQSPDPAGQVEAASAALSPPAEGHPSVVALSGPGKASRRASAVSTGVVPCMSPHSPTPPLRLEAVSPGVAASAAGATGDAAIAADADRGISAGAPGQVRSRRSSAVDRRAVRALQVAADREMGDALVKRFFDAFGVAVNAYLSGDWPLARAMLLEAQRVRPSDGPTCTLLRVIDELGVGQGTLKAAPPDWKGYRVLTEK